MEECVRIREIKTFKDFKQVHVDTRNFTAILSKYDFDENVMSLIKDKIHDTEFLIRENDIMGFLLKLESESGGVGNWRHLILNNRWLKYIRMYRIDKDNFIICDRLNYPIKKSDLYTCFCK